jgi:hypothetical protein
MERAERMVFLAAALLFHIVVEMMWIMLALTAVTAVHRFVMVWRQATVAAASAGDPASTRAGRRSRGSLPNGLAGAPEARAPDDRRRTRARRVSRVPGRR